MHTQDFTTVEDFKNLLEDLPTPPRVVEPERRVKKVDFKNSADYYRALADAHDHFDDEKEKATALRKEYYRMKNEILEEFRAWCIDKVFDHRVSGPVKIKAYEYVQESADSLDETYSDLEDISDLIEDAYWAGYMKGRAQ